MFMIDSLFKYLSNCTTKLFFSAQIKKTNFKLFLHHATKITSVFSSPVPLTAIVVAISIAVRFAAVTFSFSFLGPPPKKIVTLIKTYTQAS